MVYKDGEDFITYCEKPYDRHKYKVITTMGDYVFHEYDDMRMFWWHHKDVSLWVEILDITRGKGF